MAPPAYGHVLPLHHPGERAPTRLQLTYVQTQLMDMSFPYIIQVSARPRGCSSHTCKHSSCLSSYIHMCGGSSSQRMLSPHPGPCTSAALLQWVEVSGPPQEASVLRAAC